MSIKVPYGYVYLTGENRRVSRDSRDYGSIPYGLIQSRVLLRVCLIFWFWYKKKNSGDNFSVNFILDMAS